MWHRISNFVLYHNGFTFLVWFVLLSAGTALAANPDVREAVASSVVTSSDTITHIDNSLIINTDIDQFDFALHLTDISEDEHMYYVTYAYRTLEIADGVWMEMEKEGSLTITKSEVGAAGFEAYIQRQLAEFIEGQRQLLAETQNIERMLGQTPLVVERSYTGLIGRFLDTKEIVAQETVPEKVVVPIVEDKNSSQPGTATTTPDIATSTEPVATSTPGTIGTSTPAATEENPPLPDEPEAPEEPIDEADNDPVPDAPPSNDTETPPDSGEVGAGG